jgi:hypothetical protein
VVSELPERDSLNPRPLDPLNPDAVKNTSENQRRLAVMEGDRTQW